MVNKPELDDVFLIHFGKKGMKWGVRKKRPDEAERKAFFKNPENRRKLVIGAAVVGGALAVGMLMTKSGRVKATDATVTRYVQQRQARAQAGQNPFGQLAQKFRDTKAASVPSPNQMIADARMAGVRNRVNQEGTQRLVDKTWRDSANLRRQVKDIPAGDGLKNLEEVKRRLNDPNYVWNL